MRFDIWKTIHDSLGLSASAEIGEQLGESPAKTREGIRQAVPVILDAIHQVVSTDDEGAKSFSEAIAQSKPCLLYRLRDQSLGANRDSFRQNSKRWVARFLGDDLSRHASQLSRKSGLSSHASRELLGMMTPVVLSAVARHQQQNQLDADGLKHAVKEQLDDLSRNRAVFEQATIPMHETASLVEATHRHFGTHERINVRSLMDRLGLRRETAEQLRRELQWTGRLDATADSLTAAPGLADGLVGRVYREIGPNTKLTAHMLVTRLGIKPLRAENLMEDLRRRGVLNTAGALEGKFRSVATSNDMEATMDYHAYLRRNGRSPQLGELITDVVETAPDTTSTELESSANEPSNWLLWMVPLLLLISLGWMISKLMTTGTTGATETNDTTQAIGSESRSDEESVILATGSSKQTDADESISEPASKVEANRENNSNMADPDKGTQADEDAESSSKQPADSTTESKTGTAQQRPAVKQSKYSNSVGEVLKKITKELNEIGDVPSAEMAMPRLNAWNKELFEIGDSVAHWTETDRQVVEARLHELLPALERSVNSMFGNEAVKLLLSKPIDDLMTALERLFRS